MRGNLLLAGILILILFVACKSTPYEQGQVLYEFHCGGCHMEDGSGLEKLIPALDTTSDYFHDPGKLVCLILKGLPRNVNTGQQMPANKALSETEMTNLLNYLGHRYHHRSQWVKFEEIRTLYDACQ
jgi:mono/diheme cytochrome c family protein